MRWDQNFEKAKTTFLIQVREDEMEEMLNKIKRYYLSALVQEEDLEKRLRKTVSGEYNLLKNGGTKRVDLLI